MDAYSKLYLDDSSDLQETLFQEIVNRGFKIEPFIEGYMKCKYRRLIDCGSARVINMTYDELLSYIKKDYKDIFVLGKNKIDSLQCGWIGRMYNILQHRLNISSEEVYKKLTFEDMQFYFRPLHTVDEEIAVEKLDKIVKNK